MYIYISTGQGFGPPPLVAPGTGQDTYTIYVCVWLCMCVFALASTNAPWLAHALRPFICAPPGLSYLCRSRKRPSARKMRSKDRNCNIFILLSSTTSQNSGTKSSHTAHHFLGICWTHTSVLEFKKHQVEDVLGPHANPARQNVGSVNPVSGAAVPGYKLFPVPVVVSTVQGNCSEVPALGRSSFRRSVAQSSNPGPERKRLRSCPPQQGPPT